MSQLQLPKFVQIILIHALGLCSELERQQQITTEISAKEQTTSTKSFKKLNTKLWNTSRRQTQGITDVVQCYQDCNIDVWSSSLMNHLQEISNTLFLQCSENNGYRGATNTPLDTLGNAVQWFEMAPIGMQCHEPRSTFSDNQVNVLCLQTSQA